MGQCGILLQVGRGMCWAGRCSLGVCSSSSSACGVVAGAAPGRAPSCYPALCLFWTSPSFHCVGEGTLSLGGNAHIPGFLTALPSTPQGQRCFNFNSWTGLASPRLQKGQSSTDPHTHQQQLDQTTAHSKCTGKKNPHEAWTIVSMLIPAILGTV